ncbi:hypothetical protein BD410DRAFT_807679 [Rickenella mellea]|uniref:Uncharacterized protein n=1 Tax=Rickenella mellea TaxID=50990 RepID=A0A4Y7PQV1_9AGAM|nr:hypothetical protein BD410DRAFT_807679 [Rickenella mellea]
MPNTPPNDTQAVASWVRAVLIPDGIDMATIMRGQLPPGWCWAQARGRACTRAQLKTSQSDHGLRFNAHGGVNVHEFGLARIVENPEMDVTLVGFVTEYVAMRRCRATGITSNLKQYTKTEFNHIFA